MLSKTAATQKIIYEKQSQSKKDDKQYNNSNPSTLFKPLGSSITPSAKNEIKTPLDKVMDEYKTLYNNDYKALLNAIPIEQYWRFFIDGDRQNEGWLLFEKKEPGYLLAMMKAFRLMLESIASNKVKNLNTLIKQLHSEATSDVPGLNYDGSVEKSMGEVRGSYRKTWLSQCPIPSGLTTGLDEILSLVKEGKTQYSHNGYQLFPMIMYEFMVGNKIEHELVTPETKNVEVSMGGVYWKSCSDISIAKEKLTLLIEWKNNPIVKIFLAHPVVQQNSSGFKIINAGQHVTAIVESFMEKTIVEFESKMQQANSNEQKLFNIFKFVQDCERFHPFVDANTRVFSMLIKNDLLIKYGFPPMICDESPNMTAGSSIYHLIPLYIRNMQRTLDLAQGVEPFQVRTQDILSKLTQAELKYFNKVKEVASQSQLLLKPKALAAKNNSCLCSVM